MEFKCLIIVPVIPDGSRFVVLHIFKTPRKVSIVNRFRRLVVVVEKVVVPCMFEDV